MVAPRHPDPSSSCAGTGRGVIPGQCLGSEDQGSALDPPGAAPLDRPPFAACGTGCGVGTHWSEVVAPQGSGFWQVREDPGLVCRFQTPTNSRFPTCRTRQGQRLYPCTPSKAGPLKSTSQVRPVQGRLAPGGSGQSPAFSMRHHAHQGMVAGPSRTCPTRPAPSSGSAPLLFLPGRQQPGITQRHHPPIKASTLVRPKAAGPTALGSIAAPAKRHRFPTWTGGAYQLSCIVGLHPRWSIK